MLDHILERIGDRTHSRCWWGENVVSIIVSIAVGMVAGIFVSLVVRSFFSIAFRGVFQ